MISVRNLTYTYPQGQAPALNGVNWGIADGEFVLVAA